MARRFQSLPGNHGALETCQVHDSHGFRHCWLLVSCILKACICVAKLGAATELLCFSVSFQLPRDRLMFLGWGARA